MSDKARDESETSDVKTSFAWGQLFAGSILAGFSVYQLALKAMSMPPSEMLAGFVATYEAVRDFLMLPFQLLHLDLTASEKDGLTATIVVFGALARTAIRYPNALFAYLGLSALLLCLVFVALWVLGVPNVLFDAPSSEYQPLVAGRRWIDALTQLVLVVGVYSPLNFVFSNDEGERSMSRFLLLNLVATTTCAGVLLLTNSETFA